MSASLNHQILVLNRLWQAVNIVGVKRGFSLLIQKNAHVILTAEQQFRVMNINEWIEYSLENQTPDGCDSIHTARLPLRIPKVLLLNEYDKMPVKEVRFNKEAVFQRDGNRCQYCGKVLPHHLLNLDHVIPRNMGGKTSWENIVTSCIDCNSRKGNRMPHQANMKILNRPTRPKRRPFVNLPKEEAKEDWLYFLPKPSR